jgi:hypothetical protein
MAGAICTTRRDGLNIMRNVHHLEVLLFRERAVVIETSEAINLDIFVGSIKFVDCHQFTGKPVARCQLDVIEINEYTGATSLHLAVTSMSSLVNPLTYLTYVLSHVRDKRVVIQTADDFADANIAHVG